MALLDIESGSVGAALVHLLPREQPRLFAQTRILVPPARSVSGSALASSVERAARDALGQVSTVAARLRNAPVVGKSHEELLGLGTVERTAIFLHPPWAGVDFDPSGRALHGAIPEFFDIAHTSNEEVFGAAPISLYSFGASAAPLLHSLYGVEEQCLVCTLAGETTELVLVGPGGVLGHATLPLGLHFLLRTLATHGGVSPAEANSVFALMARGAEQRFAMEPLSSAAKHFLEEFGDAAGALVAHYPAHQLLLIAAPGVGQWLAHALTSYDTSNIFPQGGTVRAVGPQHLVPHVSSPAGASDVPLLINTLFIDARLSGV